MPEDFSKVFTVEIFTSKEVWEVVWTCNSLSDALHRFEGELDKTPIVAVRLTSPTDVSIYG